MGIYISVRSWAFGLTWVFGLAIVLGMAGGCAAAESATKPSDIAGLRERWFDAFNHLPAVQSMGLALRDPSLTALLDAYHEAVVIGPRERGELRFVVQDEQGRPLEGVHGEVRVVFPPSLLAMEPVMTKEKVTVNGEYKVKWVRPWSGVEVDLDKDGYRRISVAFSPEPPKTMERFGDAQTMLEKGLVLPPEKERGPVRVVMPPALDWDPADFDTGTPDYQDRTPSTPDREKWPKSVPLEALVVASSKDPRFILAPERGTYALVNAKGVVVWMVQLDRGNLLGIHEMFDRNLGHIIDMSYGGSGEHVPPDDAPYQWRLYSKPKPRAPATQPANP